MKSLLKLHLSVLIDLGRQCSTDIARDIITATRRCEDEGDSFLTITLPKFAKALEKGLERGHWPERSETSEWKFHRGLPCFMRGFLLCVFDETGQLRADADSNSIRAIRQFCFLSQKIERACTSGRVQNALNGFINTDSELMYLPARLDKDRLALFVQAAHQLFGNVFQECDRKIANFELIPRHGPGAVAEKLSQKEKRNFTTWTDRLEGVFPSWRYTVNSVYQTVPAVNPHGEQPCRVVTVPKTQSTPRIIAIEPAVMQYAQQGLKRELYELIGRGPLRKVLGFQDQTRNQKMAKHASLTGEFATLDLSEASDRVHWFLVYKMLERYPHLWEFAHATRSHRADVSGEIIPLQKYASMGSANTFPFEAIVFTILSSLGIRESGLVKNISPKAMQGRISVYGDDIIVPVPAVDSVIDWLEHFGAKVNQSKSFWTGKFRESCGSEYYNGHDVTVVRVRSELPSSRNDAARIAAFIDLRNRFLYAGMWGVVGDIDKELDTFINIPYVYATHSDSAGYLHRVTFQREMPLPTGARFNPDYQRYEYKVPVLKPRGQSYRIDGEAGLLEWFHSSLRRGDLLDRYDSQERSTSFSIQRRWQPLSSRGGWAD